MKKERRFFAGLHREAPGKHREAVRNLGGTYRIFDKNQTGPKRCRRRTVWFFFSFLPRYDEELEKNQWVAPEKNGVFHRDPQVFHRDFNRGVGTAPCRGVRILRVAQNDGNGPRGGGFFAAPRSKSFRAQNDGGGPRGTDSSPRREASPFGLRSSTTTLPLAPL